MIKSRLAALKVSISKDVKEKDRGSRTIDKDASTFVSVCPGVLFNLFIVYSSEARFQGSHHW